jgi:hypothetical protein
MNSNYGKPNPQKSSSVSLNNFNFDLDLGIGSNRSKSLKDQKNPNHSYSNSYSTRCWSCSRKLCCLMIARNKMTWGKRKIEARKWNTEKYQKSRGSQIEARVVGLKITFSICKVQLANPNQGLNSVWFLIGERIWV